MSNLTKIKFSNLPRDISYREDGDTFVMEMSQSCATANMQENRAAFEAWALYARTAGYKQIVLSENVWTRELNKLEKLHYNRFLFRVHFFDKGFEWFTVSPPLIDKVESFIKTKIERDDLCINRPFTPAKPETKIPEAYIERQLVLDEYRELLNNTFGLEITEYYHQLPVGLFEGRVVSSTAIFPRSHAAIDIWGLDGKTFHMIELKVGKNQNLGVLSEVFFYACFMNEMFCNKHLEYKITEGKKKEKGLRGFTKLIAAEINSVVVHILTEQKHPQLDSALDELGKCSLKGIRFGKAEVLDFTEMMKKMVI